MWKIAQKDLKIFFSDKRAMILTLLLPIGLITLFALAFGGVGSSDQQQSSPAITLLYTDEDNSAISRLVIEGLDSIQGIDVEKIAIEDGIKQIQNGSRIADLIILKGFSDSVQQGGQLPAELLFDQSRAMEMGVLQNVVAGVLSKIKSKGETDISISGVLLTMMPYATEDARDSVSAMIKNNMRSGSENDEASIIPMKGIVGDATDNWGLIQAVAGTAIMMLLFSVSAIGAGIIQEKEDGVLRKLLQTPVAPYEILFGKMISATVISLFQLLVMFIFSWLAFGLNLFENIPALLIMIFFTAVTCATFGIFLASVATSKRQVDALRTIVILFMSAIGGSMIPLYIMPEFMQHVAKISVNYWGIQGFYDIFWRKLGMSAISDNILALSCISAIMISISVYFFRKNIIRIT